MAEQITIKDSLKIISKNRKQFALIAVFDILFVLLLLALKYVFAGFNRWFINLVYQLGFATKISYFVLLLVMIFLFILIYSFFNYMVLDMMDGMFRKIRKTAYDFGRFVNFLKVNTAIFLPTAAAFFISAMLAFSYLGDVAMEGNRLKFLIAFLVSTAVLFMLFIYSYTLLNLSHFIFLSEKTEKKLRGTVKRTAKEAFAKSLKGSSYRVYWADFRILLLFGIFLLVVHMLMKIFVFADMTAYLRYGGYYKTILESLLSIVLYFIVLLNRMSFYFLCREKYAVKR